MSGDARGAGRIAARVPSGRGKAVLAIDWWPAAELPEGTTIELQTLIASDGEVTKGTLYTPSSEATTVYCLMHPRQDVQRHPSIPALLRAGQAVWAQASRTVMNDLTLVHEKAILDVAAGMELLRERGYERIIPIGISGGAGLYSFYTAQALTKPEERIARTPAGAASGLPDAPMPVPDALALVAPHPGQGRLLLTMIDPSVTDEADPFSVDPELDPFDPANGFGEAPEGSHYSPEFLQRYRAAQHERVARIDERARELVADQRAARKRWKDGSEDLQDRRRSILTPAIATYRTDADPRCTDLNLDPSERPYGSVISARPSISNYGIGGFGRLTTPEAWLSTWSGLSSNAALERSLESITVPTIVVEYTGDCSVFPSDVQAALKASAAAEKRHVKIRSDHFGRPLTEGEDSPMDKTVEELLSWAAGVTA